MKDAEDVVETPTVALRWVRTYDLDNLSHMQLQSAWLITIMGVCGEPIKQRTEWRNVPVVDGGLVV